MCRITCGPCFEYRFDQSRADAYAEGQLTPKDARVQEAGKDGSKHPDLEPAAIVQGNVYSCMTQQLGRPPCPPRSLPFDNFKRAFSTSAWVMLVSSASTAGVQLEQAGGRHSKQEPLVALTDSAGLN